MRGYGKYLAMALCLAILAGCNRATPSSSSSSSSSQSAPEVSLEVPESAPTLEEIASQVTLEQVAKANTGEEFLSAYGKASKNVVEHNWYGHETYSAMFYIEGTGTQQSTAYEDSNGYIEVTANGSGYIFDPADNTLKVRCYPQSEYQATLEQSVDYFVFQQMDYEKLISASPSESGDSITMITEFDVADDLEYYEEVYAIKTGTIRNIYDLDPDTLRIRTLEVVSIDGGSEVPVCEVTVNTDPSYTVPQQITDLINPQNTRTVTLITDPGTTEEKTETVKVSTDAAARIQTPEGYKAYGDAAGTSAFTDNGSNVTAYLIRS